MQRRAWYCTRSRWGEADQILTLLTPDLGVISASAKGSLRLKNKLFSACSLFCYSEFSLTSGRSHYFVDSAQVKKVFHGISDTVEGMCLATYMAEVAISLSPGTAGGGRAVAAVAQQPVYDLHKETSLAATENHL